MKKRFGFQALADLMRFAGVDVPEIAAAVGKHKSAVYSWLNAAHEMKPSDIRTIAALLACPYNGDEGEVIKQLVTGSPEGSLRPAPVQIDCEAAA